MAHEKHARNGKEWLWIAPLAFFGILFFATFKMVELLMKNLGGGGGGGGGGGHKKGGGHGGHH